MDAINLNDCILITNEQYCNLESPEFKGQISLDSNNMYYMIWESAGILYKTYKL